MLLSVLALVVLWLRRRSVLDLWLMVVMCAYAVEISFPRFSAGWYAGRVFGLLSGSLVLFVLLYEITLLYRRRAEDRLRERARLLDLTHDSVFVRNTSDVITYWNRGAEELYGWSRERAVGKTTHQVLQTSFPEPLAQINAELLRTGRWEGEVVHTKRDGTQVVVASRWSLQRDEQGRPVAILETNNDVTERKRTEEALREREGRIRRLVESNVIGVIFWDLAGGITDANGAFLQSVGYSREHLLSGNVSWAGMTPPEYRAADEKAIDELMQSGTCQPFEKELIGKDGRRVAVLIGGAIIEGSKGQGVSFVLDLTQRRRTEEALQRSEQRLRQAEKMEAIGRLAGGVAHDFNNILGAILGYGEMAQKTLGEGNGVRRYVDQVMQAGARGKGLVERILAFSRSGVSERVPVHVQSVVEETLQILAASLLPQVRLENRLDAGDTAVVGDATQLHQVTMNLCTNALQAMERGGVLTVVLERDSVPERHLLSHGTLSPGPYVRLSVSDSGGGIPPAVLERMFDPFFTTKGVGDGTGLGLSLVHGIVADFGGAIDVATQAGVGTTFTVWLPAAGETPRLRAEPTLELPRGSGETVMIVDDERSLVALAEETLAELGYEPLGFDSSVAALQAFRAEPQRFDLVLTDETMPDLSGVELAREIRRLRPELPIVMMSGYGGAQLAKRARAVGVAEVLRKPLVRRDIAEALGRARRPMAAPLPK
jgi:PAS domain S-box-containing protein